MKKKPLHLKEISQDELNFYWFDLGNSTHVLYDSDMGEPIAYGSINLVVGTIRNINKEMLGRERVKCIVWFMKKDPRLGWKKVPPPVLFNWNPAEIEKKAVFDLEKNK
jgi:hypothetical protein